MNWIKNFKPKIKKSNLIKGYNGNRCEYMTNPCASQPCARGVCTNSGGSGYKCKCPSGFTGVNCETDINECSDSTKVTCYNNSTCINTIGGFICRCLTGFTGQFCELSLDNCYSNPCYNDALCLNDVGSSYQCLCQPGFAGNLFTRFIQ
jgi:Notch-like protein